MNGRFTFGRSAPLFTAKTPPPGVLQQPKGEVS